jgi:hypothetical protein
MYGNRTHDIGMIEILEDLHLAPNALFVPLDLFLRNLFERDLTGDVRGCWVARAPLRLKGEVGAHCGGGDWGRGFGGGECRGAG